MNFANRLKKEMTEGMIKALLEDAGYRVIDCGLERIVREVAVLPLEDYLQLDFPHTLRTLPDFAVMDRAETEKHLVEVKYRTDWGKHVLEDMRAQVEAHREIVLISIYAEAKDRRGYDGPGLHLRCCTLRFDGDDYQVELRHKDRSRTWTAVSSVEDSEQLWWSMTPLHEKFDLLSKNKADQTLRSAIQALKGILDPEPAPPAQPAARLRKAL